MPEVFRSPHAPSDQKAGETNYLAFAGEQCAMSAEVGVGVQFSDNADGTSSTVLLGRD